MATTTQFDRIYYGKEVGKIRIANSGVAWKGDSEQLVTMNGADIKWAQWLRVARGFQLRVGLSNHRREKLDGFDRDDHDKLSQLFKNYFSITLETKEISFKGWNWGHTDFQGQDLVFLVSDKTAFELPLDKVANSNIAGRTEVSLEFATQSSKPSKKPEDEIVEIRFHVPGTQTKVKNGDDAAEDADAEEEEISAAQVFHDQIKEKADIGQVTGDMILSFEEVLVTTPRGRYDLDMFTDFLRLRGKTYDYKILYSTISRLFLLPKDDHTVLFILSLSTPIRQGQTRYHYLIMQFATDEEITAELNIDQEQLDSYEGMLERRYEAPTYEVISTIFKGLSDKKVVGAGRFKNHDDRPCVKAHMKAVPGDLFMLEKFIFFVAKSPLLVDLTEIYSVSFSRVGSGGASARTFDLTIKTKNGPDYVFSTINKEEQENLENFLTEKKIKVKVAPTEDELLAHAGVDDEDEEMGIISSDEDAPRARGGDDDESEEDEDFQASSSDEGSPSESDGDDSDGAATASDASGDREFTKKKKGKAKEKSPKKKKAKDGQGKAKPDVEDMDVDDAKPTKSKPKPKPAKKQDNDAMDVDDAPRPQPKPKPKTKNTEDGEGPPKKKAKTSSNN